MNELNEPTMRRARGRGKEKGGYYSLLSVEVMFVIFLFICHHILVIT